MVVLGPDGKPCRVCTDFKTWTKAEKKADSSNSGSDHSSSANATTTNPNSSIPNLTTTNSAPSLPPVWDDYEPETPCPPDSIELGRHTWTFLHTAAAYYPEIPTDADRSAMTSLVYSLGRLYPCAPCASHLRTYVAHDPPKVESRDAISQWMCRLHNDVNKNLGKPQFDCSRVMERWRESLDRARCG
ncbi:hypothetical protein GGF31_006833 [Allomyces arbusculus]|nr:hypothetical protein GGF31_006833 [Allomyces arbusculus]